MWAKATSRLCNPDSQGGGRLGEVLGSEALMLMFLPPSQGTLLHKGWDAGQHSSPPQWTLLMPFTFLT